MHVWMFPGTSNTVKDADLLDTEDGVDLYRVRCACVGCDWTTFGTIPTSEGSTELDPATFIPDRPAPGRCPAMAPDEAEMRERMHESAGWARVPFRVGDRIVHAIPETIGRI